jgi:1-deoxy-D-xylulose 5-phosphate reductoisomerase
MNAYRVHRLAASAFDGAAGVQFPTAVIAELKADHVMNAVVGFATVPPTLRGEMRSNGAGADIPRNQQCSEP